MPGNPFLKRSDRDKLRNSPTPPPPPPPQPPVGQSRRHRWSPDPSPSRAQSIQTTATDAATSLARKLKYATVKLGAYVTDRPANVNGNNPLPPALPEIGSTSSVDVRHIDTRPATPPTQTSFKPLQEHRNSSIKSQEKYRRVNTVDFVLAYQKHRKHKVSDDAGNNTTDDDIQRKRFFSELRSHGILVNVDDDPTCSLDAGRTCFVLLRLSRRLLKCGCKCHTKNCNNSNGSEDEQIFETNTKDIDHQQESDDDEYHEKLTSAQRAQIVWRIILRIGRYSAKHESNAKSLDDLLEAGIISAAYPIHDGSIKLEDGEDANNINDRRILYEDWARPGLIIPRNWKSDERITDLIRQYYGIPVAVYFCWLRYYTMWLVGPAIAGLLWFSYGFFTTRNDVPTHDICDPKSQVANWILCPTRKCDMNNCGFTQVRDTCGFYRWTSAATFDRPGAVLFAIFMSFWAAAFQQLWTSHAWRLTEKNDGCSDGKCCAGCTAVSATTGHRQRPEKWRKSAMPQTGRGFQPDATAVAGSWYSTKLSYALRAVAFLATLIAVAAVPVLIVVYRGRVIGWLLSAVFHQNGSDSDNKRTFNSETSADQHRSHHHGFFLLNYANSGGEQSNWKTAMAALCATFVQLTAIVAVHRGYSAVAEWLTKYSYRSVYDPRFQSRYTAYMSCFDSANYYSSLVYIAFFKGRFVTGRGQSVDGSSRWAHFWPISLFRILIFHIREDVCDPAAAGTGCVPELCTQLAIIMVAKQIVDNALELMTPLTINVWRRWRAKESRRRKKFHGKLPDTIVETLRHPKQWQLDYQLEDTGPLGLYQEYSEMVIQYGFVIMFATAFPLAPLCALLNNILEQRLDAYKMVAAQRRPVPAYYCTNKDTSNIRGRATTSCCDNCIKLGTWIKVLKVLSIVSILYNAFMIAFTSDLLPRYVYTQISSKKSSSLEGYVAWSLSSRRNVSEFYYGKSDDANSPKECRYRGYGEDIESKPDGYREWQVLAARLTFIIVFEHCVIGATAALAYIIQKSVDKYRKNGRKIFAQRTNDDGNSEPDGWSTATAATFLGTNGVTTTVGEINHETNNCTELDDSYEKSMVRKDPPAATVVVVDIENDDGQEETCTVDAYQRLVVRPEAVKTS